MGSKISKARKASKPNDKKSIVSQTQPGLHHPTYKFVSEKDSDALAWVFVDKENMKKVPIKFPPLKPTEARAKVTYTGLCHTDCLVVRDEVGGVVHPICPGHEIVGVISHIGSQVKDLKVGDRVGFGAQRDCCDECEFCKDKDDHLCQGKLDQIQTYGDHYWGGYATHIQHPAKFFFKLPKNLPEEKVPPLFCAGVTMYAPISRYAKPGNEVAILGVGGLGHLGVMYAKAWGCKVTGFTTSKDKEEFIKKLGADRVVITSPETLMQESGKYHLVMNTLPDSGNFNEFLGLVRPKGTYVQVGAPDFSKPAQLNPAMLMFREINAVGTRIGSREKVKEMLEFSGKHNILPICEHYDFEDFPKAYDKLLNGKPYFRCVVDVTKVSRK